MKGRQCLLLAVLIFAASVVAQDAAGLVRMPPKTVLFARFVDNSAGPDTDTAGNASRAVMPLLLYFFLCRLVATAANFSIRRIFKATDDETSGAAKNAGYVAIRDGPEAGGKN